MARVLLIDETPGRSALQWELKRRGHRVMRCGGGPTPNSTCPLLRGQDCPLPHAADLVVFTLPLKGRLLGRSYSGQDLLDAYRAMPGPDPATVMLVAYGDPGPQPRRPVHLEVVDAFSTTLHEKGDLAEDLLARS